MHSIKPLKHLGQNFLTDTNIAKKIINLLGDIKDKKIYEIGPGTGILTELLINSGANLTCVEVDNRAVELLEQKFSSFSNFKIIHSDIRKITLPEIICYASTDTTSFANNKNFFSVIGNIPYNITNDIIFWLLNNSANVDIAIFTMQKEVAQRITANVGTKQYGITTLALQLYCKAKISFHIQPNAFYPSPKVTSSVLMLDFKNKELFMNENKKEILELIRASFSSRRKILANSLSNYLIKNNIEIENLRNKTLNYKLTEEIIPLLKIYKNILQMRAEQLSLNDFILLKHVIDELK